MTFSRSPFILPHEIAYIQSALLQAFAIVTSTVFFRKHMEAVRLLAALRFPDDLRRVEVWVLVARGSSRWGWELG
jgi:hypothetical protein